MRAFIVEYWLGIVFGLCITGFGFSYRKLLVRIKKQEAIEEGIVAILRDRIIQVYNHYNEKGYCPIYAKDNVEEMYQQYHLLGGNGTVTGLVEKLRELPTEKEEE